MTKEQFALLGEEWLACERYLGDAEDKETLRRAAARQREIEELQNSAPFEFGPDGEVLDKIEK